MRSSSRALPIIDHLSSKNSIEDKRRDESGKNCSVVDFLESGEDSRKGAEEVIEHLN